ncbi:MAG: hypothetical protein H7641_03860, partial [Candidatus Heimdallarchaeota archaeon]|nr:hypothetical protein [Candidatus Heimdallarchaeota archaeon]MCK4876699.1 hypothetical protein [Candidatus Heimdallarchaeota archaeon]
MPEEQQLSNFLDSSSISNREKINDKGNNLNDKDSNSRIRQELIEGDFKTIGYFAYDALTASLDDDGPSYEWVEYDDIPGHDISGSVRSRFAVGTNIGTNHWPTANYEKTLGIDMWAPNYNGTMFSPVFVQEHTIKGKVYFLLNIHRDFDLHPSYDLVQLNYTVTLWHHNSTDYSNTYITHEEYETPDAGGGEYFTDFTLNATIPSEKIIPAGDRLKVTYEVSIDNISVEGHTTLQVDQRFTTSVNWDIVDGIYTNSYSLTGIDQTLGVQLYMKSNEFPDIDLYNALNETVYQNAQVMTIDVTDGSISEFRWDGGGWNNFDDSTTTEVPTSHGWHDLEVVASDPVYNNTQTTYYQIGYDASIINIELHAPYTNGSVVESGSLLNFSAYFVDTVTYEWDQNGTQFPLVDPYDIITPMFEEEHNLTIRTTDYYTSETFIYFFTFDADPPTIQLDNVVNGSTYAPLKTIDVEIFDTTGIKNVKYHWDSDANTTWNPFSGNIYRTNLPITDGNHFLYVYAFDNYGHSDSKVYYFYADSNVFLVELQDLTNDSYYLGGETVKVTVQKSNGTARYVWDSGIIEDGSIISSTLTLEGSEGIPLAAGSHNLTVITFDITNVQHVFYFNFIVDHEAPVIDTDISIYNNSRFLESQIFIFNITDNHVSGSNLTVLISIDGKANELLNDYQLALTFFEDGQHSFYLYAIDKAGNIDEKFIEFVVDTTKPEISVLIPELYDNTGVDGNLYVPYNAEVIVIFSDDDPLVTTTYAWDTPPYVPFNNSFYLDYTDGQAILRIKVSDSLENTLTYQITLI